MWARVPQACEIQDTAVGIHNWLRFPRSFQLIWGDRGVNLWGTKYFGYLLLCNQPKQQPHLLCSVGELGSMSVESFGVSHVIVVRRCWSYLQTDCTLMLGCRGLSRAIDAVWWPHGLSDLSSRSTDCLHSGLEHPHTMFQEEGTEGVILLAARPEPSTVLFQHILLVYGMQVQPRRHGHGPYLEMSQYPDQWVGFRNVYGYPGSIEKPRFRAEKISARLWI